MINSLNQPSPFFLYLNSGFAAVASGGMDKERWKLNAYAFGKLAPNTFNKGEIASKESTGRLIYGLLTKCQGQKITTNLCKVILADQEVFTKYLNLPKVKSDELESTINYKIKEFLPYQPEEIYLDWQVIAEKKDQFEVSVVAVKKIIIDSYLETLKLINVIPLSFEPESFSLARLMALVSLEPSLLIYTNSQKVIFCFGEKMAPLLVTIIHYNAGQKNEQEILLELKKSIKFWQNGLGREKKIKRVFFTGETENELIYSQITKENLNLPLQKLALPVNLPFQFPYENLTKLIPFIGLAMAQKDPQKFGQMTLIPKKIQEARAIFQLKSKLKLLCQITVVALGVLLSIYLFVFLNLFFQLEITKAGLSGWEKVVFTARQSALEKQTLAFNQKLNSLDQALKKRQVISTLFLDFFRQLPAGAAITEFSYDEAKNTIQLKGTASSREDILVLEKSLTKFGQTSIPLSSFEESRNPKFSILIKLKPQN